ncbi:MAG: biotin/lipoyl-containing protein [Chlamydiia bacterium]
MRGQQPSHFTLQTAEDGTVLIALSAFAKEEFKTVQWIEPPAVGKRIALNDVLLSIESTKAIFELESPVSGSVLEVNVEKESPLDLLIRMQPATH